MARGKLYQSSGRVFYENADGLKWNSSRTKESFEPEKIQIKLQNSGLGVIVSDDKGHEFLNTQVYNAANEADSLANESGTAYANITALETLIKSFIQNVSSSGGGGSGSNEPISFAFTQLDLAGELPISEKTTLIDIKRIGRESTLIETILGGSATATHSVSDSATQFQVTTGGDYVIQKTYQKTPYFSGKPIEFQNTFFNFQPETDIVKRIGYFTSSTAAPYDSNLDGIIIESSAGIVSLKVYKNGILIVDRPQSQWNIDKLDGTGASGETLDWSKFQIMNVDFLWLGGGPTQIAFEIGDRVVIAHREKNPNVLTSTYMRESNKPLRWEIRSTSAAGSMNVVCSDVTSRGSANAFNIVESLEGSASSLSGNLWKPIIAMRLKDGMEHLIPLASKYETFCATNADFKTKLFICHANSNPVTPYLEVSGVPTDWDSIAFTTGKDFEYKNDFNNTFELIVSSDDGFAGSFGTSSSDTSTSQLNLSQYVGQELDGSKDVLVLAIKKTGTGTENYEALLDINFFQ